METKSSLVRFVVLCFMSLFVGVIFSFLGASKAILHLSGGFALIVEFLAIFGFLKIVRTFTDFVFPVETGPSNVIVENGVYQHYKGAKYLVIGTAIHSETKEEMAIYRPLYDNKMSSMWVRPSKMFSDVVGEDTAVSSSYCRRFDSAKKLTKSEKEYYRKYKSEPYI